MLKHKLDFSKKAVECKDKICINKHDKSNLSGIKKSDFKLPRNVHYEIEVDFDEYFFSVELCVN